MRALPVVALVALTASCRPASPPPAAPAPASTVAPASSIAPPPGPAPSAELALTMDAAGIHVERTGEIIVPTSGDPSMGADARFKRSGPNDLYLVPLAEALTRELAAHGEPQRHLAVVVDPRTPYRILTEMMFTAGQLQVGTFELFEGSRTGRTLTFEPPRPHDHRTPGGPTLSLVAVLIAGGVSLKAAGANVAPGCVGAGPGIAFPAAAGAVDLAALGACVAKLKASQPAFAAEEHATVVANPTVPFHDVLDVALTLQGPTKTLLPKITFGIAR
jgi:hypothetical protein